MGPIGLDSHVISIAPLNPCGICLEDLQNGEPVFAHPGEGAKHPLHMKCLREAVLVNGNCPFCRIPLDIKSLYTWLERVNLAVKVFASNAAASALSTCVFAIDLDPAIVLGMDMIDILSGQSLEMAIATRDRALAYFQNRDVVPRSWRIFNRNPFIRSVSWPMVSFYQARIFFKILEKAKQRGADKWALFWGALVGLGFTPSAKSVQEVALKGILSGLTSGAIAAYRAWK